MSEENTGTESVETSESNASSESAPAAQTQDASSGNEAASTQSPKETPFHEHPRFRELVEQKNQYSQQIQQMQQAYQRQFAEMQAQLQKLQQPAPQQPQYTDVFKELEQVNPHFAKLQQEIYGKLSATEQLQQKFEQFESQVQAERTQREAAHAQSEFSRLCSENKVSDTDKELYMERVANMANARGAKVSDLPALFKEAHQGLSKYLDNVRRSERESYTKAKAGDARPASQTGGTPVGKSTAPSSLDDVKSRIAAAMRSAKNP